MPNIFSCIDNKKEHHISGEEWHKVSASSTLDAKLISPYLEQEPQLRYFSGNVPMK